MAKILVAEDERDIRDLVAFTLRFAGHEVVAVSNGEEAVDCGREGNSGLDFNGCAHAANDRL